MLLKTLFESAELPADFIEKAETLFGAAVNEKVDIAIAEKVLALQESFDAKLQESKAEFVTEATITLDAAIEETILEWAKENAVPLDNQIKAQLAEGFLTGLKTMFEKADIEMNSDLAGTEIQKLNEQKVELQKQVDEKQVALDVAQKVIVEGKIKEILESVTSGLADTVAHRVIKLCESFDFKSVEDFRSKAELVVEAIVGGKKVAIKGTVDIDGAVIPVSDSADGKLAQASTESGAAPIDTLVAEPVKRAKIPKDKGADGLREQYDALAEINAPHLNSDMVALTLEFLKK